MTAQADFDKRYISSTEVREQVGVTRATIMNAYKRGTLPEPIRINKPNGDTSVMLWLRDEVAPYIERWKTELVACNHRVDLRA